MNKIQKNMSYKNVVVSLSEPVLQGNEWRYVKECIDSGWVSGAGNFVTDFENKIAAFVGARYAVACVNGTSALHIALKIIGVGVNDEVIVPTVTFIAPVNAVRYLGAEPVFMDCDDFYNIDIDKTIRFLKEEIILKKGVSINKKTGRPIKAIIPVHVFGNAVDLEKIVTLCRQRNIKIVEDATESVGTYYRKGKYINKYTGTIGDIGCYSFNGNKIITAGGGGMIVTDNNKWAQKALYLTTQAKDDGVKYIHNEVGYNFRLSNIQAALGIAQLERLGEFIAAKKRNYDFYKKRINKLSGFNLASTPAYAKNNHWMYALQVYKDKDKVIQYLRKNNIQVRPLWCLNHRQKPYKNNQAYCINKAYKMMDITLNLPCSSNLTLEDIDKVVNLLRQCGDNGKN